MVGQTMNNILLVGEKSDLSSWSSLPQDVQQLVVNTLKISTPHTDSDFSLLRFSSGTHESLKAGIDLVILKGFEEANIGVLSELVRLLKPGRHLLILSGDSSSSVDKEGLKTNLTLSGFVDTKLEEVDSKVRFITKKPEWEVGAAQPLKLRKKNPPASTSPSTPSKPQSAVSWSIGTTDELEDEDSLLTDEDLQRPSGVSLKKEDDCEIGKGGQRKACKNCSCGRAELEDKAVKITDSDEVSTSAAPAKSACGNCYLGDAFRCSGCPYLGKPAFKPGETVTLDLSDDF